MKRLLAALAVLSCAALPAHSQTMLLGVENAGTSYTGPGDVVSGAAFWGGLRAYSRAKALAGAKAIQLCTAIACGGGTTEDEIVGTDGKMIFGTKALTCDNAGNQCYVGILYDQSGNGHDQPSPSGAVHPLFIVNCVGSFPCMGMLHPLGSTSAGVGVSALPITISWIAQRTASFTTQMSIVSFQNLSDHQPQDQFFPAANEIFLSAGTNQIVSAADSTWHTEQSVYNNATTPGAILDGTATTLGGSPGSTAPANNAFCIGGAGSCTNEINGAQHILEVGIWGSAFTGPQGASMNTNQKTYWGF
jgi:hypothetical protein